MERNRKQTLSFWLLLTIILAIFGLTDINYLAANEHIKNIPGVTVIEQDNNGAWHAYSTYTLVIGGGPTLGGGAPRSFSIHLHAIAASEEQAANDFSKVVSAWGGVVDWALKMEEFRIMLYDAATNGSDRVATGDSVATYIGLFDQYGIKAEDRRASIKIVSSRDDPEVNLGEAHFKADWVLLDEGDISRLGVQDTGNEELNQEILAQLSTKEILAHELGHVAGLNDPPSWQNYKESQLDKDPEKKERVKELETRIKNDAKRRDELTAEKGNLQLELFTLQLQEPLAKKEEKNQLREEIKNKKNRLLEILPELEELEKKLDEPERELNALLEPIIEEWAALPGESENVANLGRDNDNSPRRYGYHAGFLTIRFGDKGQYGLITDNDSSSADSRGTENSEDSKKICKLIPGCLLTETDRSKIEEKEETESLGDLGIPSEPSRGAVRTDSRAITPSGITPSDSSEFNALSPITDLIINTGQSAMDFARNAISGFSGTNESKTLKDAIKNTRDLTKRVKTDPSLATVAKDQITANKETIIKNLEEIIPFFQKNIAQFQEYEKTLAELSKAGVSPTVEIFTDVSEEERVKKEKEARDFFERLERQWERARKETGVSEELLEPPGEVYLEILRLFRILNSTLTNAQKVREILITFLGDEAGSGLWNELNTMKQQAIEYAADNPEKTEAEVNALLRESARSLLENVFSKSIVSGEPEVKKLLNYIVDNFDSNEFYYTDAEKIKAAKSLGDLAVQFGVQKSMRDDFVNALKDESPLVRSAAAEALGRIGGDSATQALADALNSEKYFFVRETISDALMAIGNAGIETDNRTALYPAIDALIKALKDENWAIRLQAVRALGVSAGGDEVLDALEKISESDKDEKVRDAAIEAVKSLGGVSAAPPFEKDQIEFSKGEDVISGAAPAKGFFGRAFEKAKDFLKRITNVQIPQKETINIPDAIHNALYGDSFNVRQTAIAALGDIGIERHKKDIAILSDPETIFASPGDFPILVLILILENDLYSSDAKDALAKIAAQLNEEELAPFYNLINQNLRPTGPFADQKLTDDEIKIVITHIKDRAQKIKESPKLEEISSVPKRAPGAVTVPPGGILRDAQTGDGTLGIDFSKIDLTSFKDKKVAKPQGILSRIKEIWRRITTKPIDIPPFLKSEEEQGKEKQEEELQRILEEKERVERRLEVNY